MKTNIRRALLVLFCISLTSVTYAIGLRDVVPAGHSAGRHIPESLMLLFLGITMLVVAHHSRRPSPRATKVDGK